MDKENINDQDILTEEDLAEEEMPLEDSEDDLQLESVEEDAAHPLHHRKKKKTSRKVIIIFLAVLLVIIGAGIAVIHHYIGMIQVVDSSTLSTMSPSEFLDAESRYWASINGEDVTTTVPGSSESDNTNESEAQRYFRMPFQANAYRATLSADDEQVIFDHPVTPTWVPGQSLGDEDLINIMLVGQDTRNIQYRERSDSMILVSINPKTHKVALVSFLRDCYVPIGGDYGWNRLNTAYFIGGLPKMYEVFNNVFGLHIDGSIYINFGQFMSLVDLLGGVDLTLNETEARWLRYTLEQSVPDMRYWGQIVEAQMPEIKEGTTVQDAITALEKAKLTYAFSDAHGGAAPDDASKATVKLLTTDAAGENVAKVGKYYPLDTAIYITYNETRITFPVIPAESSVASAAAILKDSGFTVEYSDKNGGTAPADSKSALVVSVSTDAEGKTIPAAGDKFKKGTKVYITYTENKAIVPNIPADTTVQEAETLLKANGFKVAYTTASGSTAPADKEKALVTGIYTDRAGTKAAKVGDKLDVNSTIYISYELIPESTEASRITLPEIRVGEAVSSAYGSLTAAGFKVAYAASNGGKAPNDPDKATVVKISSDPNGNNIAAPGTEWEAETTMYITYVEKTEPSTEETQPPTESSSSETEPSNSETQPSSSETEPSSSETEPTQPEESTEPAPGTSADPGETQPTSESGDADLPTEPTRSDISSVRYAPSAGEIYAPIVRTMSILRTSDKAAEKEEDLSVPYYLRNIKEGKVHLTGMQTLAYCRMRKLDSDFKRTERQRMVLNILFNKIKSSDLGTLNNVLKQLLGQVATDMSEADIFLIAAQVLPYFSSINLELHSIPAPGCYGFATINGMAVVTINQEGNVAALKSWLPF